MIVSFKLIREITRRMYDRILMHIVDRPKKSYVNKKNWIALEKVIVWYYDHENLAYKFAKVSKCTKLSN